VGRVARRGSAEPGGVASPSQNSTPSSRGPSKARAPEIDDRDRCDLPKAVFIGSGFALRAPRNDRRHSWRSTIIRLISAMAFAGLRPFGHAFEQFKMVWQR